jgi:hypothetical protein
MKIEETAIATPMRAAVGYRIMVAPMPLVVIDCMNPGLPAKATSANRGGRAQF